MRTKVSLSLFLIVMLAGCYKDPLYDELSSNFTVVTNRDTKAVFSSYKTYYISDTVAYASSKPTDSFLVGAEAKMLVDAVKSNMLARGYTFVPRTAKPDLGVSLGAIKDVDVGVIYSGGWWGYGGWYGGYWGGYYPYYPYYGIPYAISQGSVVIDMFDVKNSAASHKLTVIWNLYSNGGISTTTSINFQRGVDAINQAFTQSPYIKAN